ncbi:hypothetical protein BDP81DRAFT_465720 [Colletotrichum phormii]|uniref:Uncharacterized protein n=1 Tax=Colletotrichum phormii TaxID=359342 RepID=A0AAI9ZE94_9PEZI|nr:uncharacterized protein BDP81DRAFT_465720 [Colletotrichum phormii]KAK1622939.1 hypothetical protein BDP81DRAFT_465720 [Colletotrichum phormii]
MISTSAAVDAWGGSVSLGPMTSTIKAVTTIIPGAAPPTQNGSWPDNFWCGAMKGQWCVRASLFGSFGQLSGDASAVSGTQKVKIDYELLSNNNTWRQTVTHADTDAKLSSFEHKSGSFMRGYGTGTECNANYSPTVSAHKYIDTVITLTGPDTGFGKTIATAQKATYSSLSSSQSGKIRTINAINVPAMK